MSRNSSYLPLVLYFAASVLYLVSGDATKASNTPKNTNSRSADAADITEDDHEEEIDDVIWLVLVGIFYVLISGVLVFVYRKWRRDRSE